MDQIWKQKQVSKDYFSLNMSKMSWKDQIGQFQFLLELFQEDGAE